MNSWQLFRRYLFSKKSDSVIKPLGWLVLVSTFVSVTSLTVVMCIMNGFNKSFRSQLLASTPHIEVKGDAVKLQSEIANLNLSITNYVPYSRQDVVVRTGDGKFSGAVARGISEEEINSILLRLKLSQKLPVFEDYLKLQSNEVVISESLARQIKVYPGEDIIIVPPEGLLLPPGESPPIERVRIKSFFSSDVGEYSLNTILFVENATLSKFSSSKSRTSGLELQLNYPDEHRDIKELLVDRLKIQPDDVMTWAERNSTTFFALRMEKMAIAFMLSLAVLVTSFGIVMVMMMLVVEKERDIGLFLALGQSISKTQILFSKLGLYLAGYGLFGGLIFGLVVSLILKFVPLPEFPDIYSIRELPVDFDFIQLLIMILGLSLLSILAAWVPVKNSLKLTPVEALRGGASDN